MIPRLKKLYQKEFVSNLKENLSIKNVMQVPKIEKIVLNMGLGLDATDNKILKVIQADLANLTGQQPVLTKAKKAVANFKTRKDVPMGLKVTLRKKNMYYFIDRLINMALPRIKDFRGLNPDSFDKEANYSFGIKEHVIFPEVNFDKIEKMRGMDITVVTSTKKKNQSRALLDSFKFPFYKKGSN